MRVLGIDYGNRRIGLAISDEIGLIAHGLPTLTHKAEAQVLAALRQLIEEHDIAEIVVGLPRNMDGSIGPQAEKAMAFAESLEALGLPVHLVDERLTTERAKRALEEAGLTSPKHRAKRDRMAAQFILQTFLDTPRSPPA